jgi:hypothetical protein
MLYHVTVVGRSKQVYNAKQVPTLERGKQVIMQKQGSKLEAGGIWVASTPRGSDLIHDK